MDIEAVAQANLKALRANPYPGRGIVIGLTPDETRMVQVYWIMGRSHNSRNRVFVQEGDLVRTAPFDASEVEDPALIIYNAIRVRGSAHIVSNGDQTDTIHDALATGATFEAALDRRRFEPDAPNYTPRIAGLVDAADPQNAYKLAILKTVGHDPQRPVRQYFNYEAAIPGVGHLIATYQGDGSPLPAFEGEPRIVPLRDDLDDTLDLYWNALNADNRVSLVVKHIDPSTNESTIRIVNRNA